MHAESLLLVGPEKLVWTLDDLDTPGPNEVLVETLAGAISIGTELPHYLGNSRGNARHYPAMTGYESVARVLACGDRVNRLKPGDRIVGSSDGWDYHEHAGWFFERARDQQDLLRRLFEWHVTVEELPETFRRLAHGAVRPLKVFVRYRS